MPRERTARPRRLACLALALALGGGPVMAPTPGWASGEGQSGSDSSNGGGSNNSSKSSGDSSNTSNDSSKSSQESSKNSNASTETSPQRSADSSSDQTVESSTKSREAQVFWMGSAVVLLGASVLGTVLVAHSRSAAAPPHAVALARFIRENHAMLAHDVALTRGAVFDAWSRQLGLDATERDRVAAALEGSREQGELLDALDGQIDVQRARRFSAAYFRVTARALGPARTATMLARAAGAGPAAQSVPAPAHGG